MSWSDFLQGALNDGLKTYGEVSKIDAQAEADKWQYLQNQQTVPQNTGDPNEFREVEPVKGQNSLSHSSNPLTFTITIHHHQPLLSLSFSRSSP